MNYYDYSQHVRSIIGTTLDDTLRECIAFQRPVYGIGSSIDFFCLGHHAGHYVGLRLFSPYHLQDVDWSWDTQLKKMEAYCKNAEMLREQGKRVPAFCIGVIADRVGILTEDISQNGRRTIRLPDAESRIIIDGTEHYIDIDYFYHSPPIHKLTYLAQENAITL